MSIRMDMIGLVVKDIAESIRFYRALGLAIPDPDGGPYYETILEGGIRLSFNDLKMIKEIEPDWQEPIGQRIGLAFLCEPLGAVDSVYASMVAAGFKGHREPWDAFWGQRYAQVEDPDGNVVDLFHPLAS